MIQSTEPNGWKNEQKKITITITHLNRWINGKLYSCVWRKVKAIMKVLWQQYNFCVQHLSLLKVSVKVFAPFFVAIVATNENCINRIEMRRGEEKEVWMSFSFLCNGGGYYYRLVRILWRLLLVKVYTFFNKEPSVIKLII